MFKFDNNTLMINKPYSESCDQNKAPILSVIEKYFSRPDATVLEIGSGTGQHASYFPKQLSYLNWQPSDIESNIQGIEAWRLSAQLTNVYPTKILDVMQSLWPIESAEYIFSANTLHIMSWAAVEAMFAGIRSILKPNGLFCVYGPFNYNGQFTSASNTQFDQWLKSRDPKSGIRDFEALCALGTQESVHPQLKLINDHAMPANNRILVFQSHA